MILPIKLEDLLYCRGVESQSVEFKVSWNASQTGPQVLKTIYESSTNASIDNTCPV